MSEYIKREDAINKFKGMVPSVTRSYIVDAINAIPAADVEPVVWGKWEKMTKHTKYRMGTLRYSHHPNGTTYFRYRCTSCLHEQIKHSNYCPNCGAHMERSGSGE